MKKLLIIIFIFLSVSMSMAQAPSIFGTWKTIDDASGEEKSTVEIYERDGKLYGKIIGIVNPADEDKTCIYCKGADKDKPIIGLEIIKGLEKDGSDYEGGTITDPENGKVYKSKIWLDEDNPALLNVRGYIGIFFRTQQWVRM